MINAAGSQSIFLGGLGRRVGAGWITDIIRSLAAGQDKADRQFLIVAAGVDLARKAAA